jgi:hypothetical protein
MRLLPSPSVLTIERAASLASLAKQVETDRKKVSNTALAARIFMGSVLVKPSS